MSSFDKLREHARGITCEKQEFINSCNGESVNDLINIELTLGSLLIKPLIMANLRVHEYIKTLSLQMNHPTWTEFNNKLQNNEEIDVDQAINTLWQIAYDKAYN